MGDTLDASFESTNSETSTGELSIHGASSSDSEQEIIEYTPLHIAIKRNKLSEVEGILKSSTADIDVAAHGSPRCGTPLMLALFKKNYKIAEMLLAYGANIDKNIDTALYKEPPLQYFSEGFDRNLETVSFLLKHKANVNAVDKEGWNALDNCLIGHEDKKYMKLLVLYGAVRDKIVREEITIAEKFDKFFKQLAKEIESMKIIKLNSKYSLYDYLFMSEKQLAKFTDNQVVKDVCYTKKSKKMFPQYGHYIKRQYEIGRLEHKLLNLSKVAFDRCTKVNLPDLCWDKIVDYLTEDDLKNLSLLSPETFRDKILQSLSKSVGFVNGESIKNRKIIKN